jgi:geranylgeranyl reductase family protein
VTTWDAIVVGGGPAGSTVAWQLARSGRRVLVLDAARFPRVKLCAGWVTHAVLADLELDASTYPHTIQSFDTVTLAVGDVTHATRWDHVASFGIVRREFDAFLLERARSAGAAVRDGVRVRDVERSGDGLALTADGERLSAPLVVGAGGYRCPIARALGDVSPSEDVVVTQESETKVGADRLRALTRRYGVPELLAEPDFHGYGWYFTKGDFLNVGIGAQGGLRIAERLQRMLALLRADGRLPHDVTLAPFKGHAYAVRRARPRRVGGRGFVLVGDGAGLARDLSGEGIGPAVRSARLAVASILAGRADDYPARIDAAFGRPRGFVSRLANLVPERAVTALARTVCAQPWSRRRLVLEGAFGIG